MAEDSVHNEKTSTRHLIKQYVAHWKLLLLSTALSIVLILLWYHRVELEYTGTAIFERRMDPVSAETSLQGSESFSSRKKTLPHDLASWNAVAEAVEQLGLTKKMERNPIDGSYTARGDKAKQQLVRELSRKIAIKWEVSSERIDLVSVSFTHSDPTLAEQMPNVLVANYINRVSMQAEENWTKSKEFYEQRADACHNKLAGLIKQRIDFEEEHKGAIPENSGMLYDQIFQITSDLDAYRLQHDIAKQALVGQQGFDNGSEQDPNEPREVLMIPNPLLEQRKNQLQQAEDELRNLTVITGAKETYWKVKALKRHIESLKQQIEETEPLIESEYVFGKPENSNLAFELFKTKATMDGTKAHIDRLQSKKEKYEEILINFGTIQQNYQELNRNIEATQNELSRWKNSLQSAEMALVAEVAKRSTHLNAVQAAMKQYRPSDPNLLYTLAIALIGGLAVGGLLVFLAIRIDQTVITPEQAAKGFGIPVFGFVGFIRTPRTAFIQNLKRWVLIPVVSIVIVAVLGIFTFSLTLRLQHPDEYKSWRKNEIKYLTTQAGLLWNNMKNTISGTTN